MVSASAAADDVDEEKSIVTGTWHERVWWQGYQRMTWPWPGTPVEEQPAHRGLVAS